MPRQKGSTNSHSTTQTLILDNGAFTLKAGLATSSSPSIIPNCIARASSSRTTYVGRAVATCTDKYHMVLRRAHERGMVTHWDVERAVWYSALLGPEADVRIDPHETALLLTESVGTFPALLGQMDQVVFEEFEFRAYARMLGAKMVGWNDTSRRWTVVVDSGYSHTTVVPLIDGLPVHRAMKRLDIGGKHLSNYLAELLAVREISLKEDAWIANEVKEAVTFVSQDFKRDMERTWRGHTMDPTIAVDVQLPDYQNTHQVVVKPWEPTEQVIKNKANIMAVGNERFQVPEILFNPSDIGMPEAGLAEVIMQSVDTLPEGLRPVMYENIVVVGGNAKIPGFVERLETELRQMIPDFYRLHITCPEDSVTYTWQGGVKMAENDLAMKKHLVTRAEYLEHGSNWLLRKFEAQGD